MAAPSILGAGPQRPPTHRVGGPAGTRVLSLEPGAAAATLAVEGLGAGLSGASEVALVLDRSRWRHDVDAWRYASTDEDCSGPAFDDAAWRRAPHLHVVHDAEHAGAVWLRHRFALPAELDGEELTFLLGGRDDEDWRSYTVYLNGSELHARDAAQADAQGRWRDAPRFTLTSEDPNYGAARFGGDNVLAVRVADLRRPLTAGQRVESEHYLFQGLLLDQVIAVGDPRVVVDDFTVERVRESEAGGHDLRALLRSGNAPGLDVSLRWWADAETGVLRKQATVANAGAEPVTLLEVRVEALACDGALTRGGRGVPVLRPDGLFAAIEHPAGVNMGTDGVGVELWQLPGARLAPGGAYTSEPAAIGTGFLDLVRSYSTRGPGETHAAYSALGWYDFTNLADPLPELTEDLAHENLDDGDALRDAGARFDTWIIDDWWSRTDLSSFRETFPSGGPALARAIEGHGLRAGLWWATTRGLWTAAEAPGMEAALAGGVAPAPAALVHEAGGKFSWNEEFASLFLHEPRYCMAAEPYRTSALEAIPRHAEELSLSLLKLDCVTLHCTASGHDHLPGIYSVEPMMKALIDVARRARDANPDLWVIWYWGFRSPFWLRFGDLTFDKGIKLEAASPASAPAWSARQSISLNVDQSIEHARDLLPLEGQDSLGIWVGDVAWANRLGREEWRDAFLLDAARGSRLLQLWGDLKLLDAGDRAFLGDVLAWAQERDLDLSATRRVGADPWTARPYGYLQQGARGRIVTLFNPTFAHAPVPEDTALGEGRAIELHPVPGADGAADLAPFETRVVELDREGSGGTARAPLGRPTRTLDVAALGAALTAGERAASMTITLPEVARGDHVVLVVRLKRDGQWLYHPDPRELFDVRLRMLGIETPLDAVPRTRSRNGPGSPWVRYATPGGVTWSGQELAIDVAAHAEADVEIITEALVFDPWWETVQRRFEAITSTTAAIAGAGA
ncbi:MAG TPA: hypothetical protein VFG42_14465 [Baekduia sp.]|uniref:hypothetical protein n=1 Tax=Baekduia sp. TaxID=2600305 RepID=UPI002D767690|nr:hypothetical protein [Baekduia sp.]HET6507991.1 hypothetical protein [Baekduia sp.]